MLKTTNWFLKIWNSWCEHRGIAEQIETLSDEDLNNYLSYLIFEVKRQDGSPYPLSTLHEIVAGRQRHLKESRCPELGILD